MTVPLQGSRVLVVGATSGIGRRIAADVAAAGARVTMTGRDPDAVRKAVAEVGPGAEEGFLDLSDEDSIVRLAERTGAVDHVVNLAAAPANGPLADLDRAAVVRAFDAKVVGALMLAKHFGPLFRPGGSMLLFSGLAAWRPAPGRAVMATANGAVSFLATALAVELAPVRVNALSPGVVDSGAWDSLGAGREEFFRSAAAANPARRIGHPADVSAAALFALTNPFVTGTTLHVDGGGRL